MAKVITKTELINAIQNGVPLVVVEYRSSKAETLKWRDKVSGKALSAPVLRHTVEYADGSMGVSERVEEDKFKPEEYEAPFKKGDKVILKFNGWRSEKGAVTASGALLPYDSTK